MMEQTSKSKGRTKLLVGGIFVLGAIAGAAYWASQQFAPFKPIKDVELIVPAGTGGGADQMARAIAKIVNDNRMLPDGKRLIVVNKSAAAGAEGFLDMRGSRGDPHKLVITLSNLFTTPLSEDVPFAWDQITPLQMQALDQFVLWVKADAPYASAKEYMEDVKKRPEAFQMGGTGQRQEDEIVTRMIDRAMGTKTRYRAYAGGGAVANALAAGEITSSVNNPIEALAQWRAGKVKPLCVFDKQRMPYKDKVAGEYTWNDIPTCIESGVPVEYTMLRGLFMADQVRPQEMAYYIDLMGRVRSTADWQKLMSEGAFNTTVIDGQPFRVWLADASGKHDELMRQNDMVAKD